ncbi:DEAD/DEAH box helicase [Cryobacterium sp. BB307]|uniref:DEAD/DEAH box helicase n=1 Tax=Cryobacterium sp. BB307 TaxID=2716317 RepID=UPI001444B8CA|nr:DEAD/DEAH box helicase [Cryobacterium sp. BB307]
MTDERYEPLAFDGSYVGPSLRNWQKKALGAWEDSGSRGVVEAITGTGKSLVGIAAIRQVVAEGGKALVLVPTRALLTQWHLDIRRKLPQARVGAFTSGRRDSFRDFDVIVSTVQSACKNPPLPTSLGLLVADEVHRYGSAQFSKALHPAFERRLALSGTYERQQDSGIETYLAPYFGPIVSSYGYSEALRDKVVSPFRVALVGTTFNASESKAYKKASEDASDARFKLRGEYFYPDDWSEFFSLVQRRLRPGGDQKRPVWDAETELCSKYMAAFALRRSILAEAKDKEDFVAKLGDAFADLSGTLVLTETKESATRLAWLIDRQTSAWPLTSDSPASEREEKLRRFAGGKIKVLCAPRILDEGIDVPEAELAVIVAASQTRRQMVQRMGRVIRLKADRREARMIILYVEGTAEDPFNGGHEAFLDQILPFAREQVSFNATEVDRVGSWLIGQPAKARTPALR